MLATMVELLHAMYRVQLMSPWFRRGQSPKPLQWPRPATTKRKPNQLTPGEFARIAPRR